MEVYVQSVVLGVILILVVLIDSLYSAWRTRLVIAGQPGSTRAADDGSHRSQIGGGHRDDDPASLVTAEESRARSLNAVSNMQEEHRTT